MPKKFYGVHKGFTPGVYTTWDECKAQVSGYKGAVYKGFSLREQAENFALTGSEFDSGSEVKPSAASELRRVCPTFTYSERSVISEQQAGVDDLRKRPEKECYAFVDGSFNPDTKVFGYGGFLVVNGNRTPIMGHGSDEELVGMRNVAGEIYGAMAAVKEAEKQGITKLKLLYDYRGIEEWATGNWKANKTGTKEYCDFMQSPFRTCDVVFQKVEAHTGIEGNEMADVMAKHAVGIHLTRSQQALFDSVFESSSDVKKEVAFGMDY